jgi:hypothetical protein
MIGTGCIDQPPAATGGPVDTPDDEEEGGDEPAPCDDYALGVNAEGDGACFGWAAVSCAAETERDACEGAIDVGSPNGDLACAWTDAASVVDPQQACAELDATRRCVSVVLAPPEGGCEGTGRWVQPDAETGEELVVELACDLVPVPDFDPCLEDSAAGMCC